jgi:3-hydroxy-9,10-secoandrosta-1,3,5(10)-triene-9,17-dione monooxygenase
VRGGSGPRQPFSDFLPFSIIGAPLGAARGAAKLFTQNQAARLESASEAQVAEAAVTLARCAEACAAIDAAIALVLQSARRVEAPGTALTPLERAQIPRDWAYGVHTARRAVNHLFEAAGGSSIYDGYAFQRLWRDVNAGSQHFAFTWDAAMAGYGRAAIGRPPAAYALKPRTN